MRKCTHCGSVVLMPQGDGKNTFTGLIEVTKNEVGSFSINMDRFTPVHAHVCQNCAHVELFYTRPDVV